MDIVISFDDTGSMSCVRNEVRANIVSLLDTLFSLIPNLRVGIIIHNDYCDRDTIQLLDLTSNKNTITQFVNRGSSTGGGDQDECYELVIHKFHQSFSWASSDRICLLIGDCNPHQVGYTYGTHTNYLDWRKELSICANEGIVVHAIQALGNRSASHFYSEVARLTNGVKLDLTQFNHITQYITAVAYKQQDRLDEYQASNSAFNTNLAFVNMFNRLRGATATDSVLESKLETMGRFQVINVPARTRINDFVASHGLRYRAGRGFYQLIKTETIQPYKEIIMVNKSTGETISDPTEARKLLGISSTATVNFNPRSCANYSLYDVYVQSTSYTRQLDAGTKFLYELERS